MRKYLLPKEGNFYKANLHCHSTVSDGKLTPAQLKEEYKKKGYSIIAYTDHDLMIAHPELKDDEFLPLTAYEMEITEDEAKTAYGSRKTCHLCYIALDEDVKGQVCWHREKYVFSKSLPYKSQAKFDDRLPDFEREYTPECINKMIKMGRDNGFFVTYNHPAWSQENYGDYSKYTGMNAMEICNYGCYCEGFEDYCPQVYDDLLRDGQRIYCVSTDDNHNINPIDSARTDSFGGFTMIKADKLEYKTITDAMVAGNLYASQGPLIYDLYLEDGKVTIKCSPASRIYLSAGKRRSQRVNADGELLTEATFDVLDDYYYFRITVEDEKGRHANTIAYFIDDLKK